MIVFAKLVLIFGAIFFGFASGIASEEGQDKISVRCMCIAAVCGLVVAFI